MSSPVPQWISERVTQNTFCDIGGIGINSVNERVSIASKSGAKRSVMIDLRPFDYPEWKIFKDKMAKNNIFQYEVIDKANLEANDFPELVGKFYFVHATGILYHAPSPVFILNNLSKITEKYLVTNTVIIPSIIENECGIITSPGSQAIFLPGLSRWERNILEVYFAEKLGWSSAKFNDNIPKLDDPDAVMPFVQKKVPSSGFLWRNLGDLCKILKA